MKAIINAKIDLDTAGTAYLLGVTREDKVVVVRASADPADLADRTTICIEVGGSGDTHLNNWDHHGPRAETEALRSATRQVAYSKGIKPDEYVIGKLVDYIDQLDVEGLWSLPAPGFPCLSDIFSGMLLSTRDPIEQLHKGIEILEEVAQRKLDPYGIMPTDRPEWAAFASAKSENNRRVAEAVEKAQWGTTSTGFKLAYLETDFIGAPGALYGVGAQIVVVYSPKFGSTKVPKFTVAGNGVRVNEALPELNAREPGWGGPATGTIIGSPRTGSKLSLNEVVRIVRETM